MQINEASKIAVLDLIDQMLVRTVPNDQIPYDENTSPWHAWKKSRESTLLEVKQHLQPKAHDGENNIHPHLRGGED